MAISDALVSDTSLLSSWKMHLISGTVYIVLEPSINSLSTSALLKTFQELYCVNILFQFTDCRIIKNKKYSKGFLNASESCLQIEAKVEDYFRGR